MQKASFTFDAIVVGIGHAGIEAALALARKNHKTLALSVSLDNAGLLACNPSIGGTAKGHLVRETDALGGEMGKAADETCTHLRMLNASKGPSVQSLRAQIDKYRYHDRMKQTLENQPNLTLREGEVKQLICSRGRVTGVSTVAGLTYTAKTVVLACGVYLNSTVIIGSILLPRGPSGFARSEYLADSLIKHGITLQRFKTGTPARVKKSTVDTRVLEVQHGEDTPYSFSDAGETVPDKKGGVCYLGYTNAETHEIIRQNLQLSPKYGGLIHGAGARYCPSVEDKVVRFADKERHPFFLEEEGGKTQEMYVQGLSTGLPAEVQLDVYRSIKGMENVEIMRDAYAIEYECIDPLQLYPTLECKSIKGLFFAGQINGTSGYEEAAAQGLVAGINAARRLEGKDGLILPRESCYIGVMIDDLVTKGTQEPYRMMTSRAEYRLLLRQDNADLRLYEFARQAGLLSKERLSKAAQKRADILKGKARLKTRLPQKQVEAFFNAIGEPPAKSGATAEECIRRNAVTFAGYVNHFDTFADISPSAAYDIFLGVKYEGYIKREEAAADEARKVGDMPIPPETDFMRLNGLRIEAKEKLSKVSPRTVGQASRIAGVTPADINVLIISLKSKNGN
ncbi:MAG: tRNA uridine-5-carboxymethylaminomethyl(34) synthesis enzyme MnmG [Firmicutes bacterium]|nr:tRNA uridine-5-carboxymethylaminomethyl(34) synthesis enzyme MnmG [Bacillota bacterium]